jgi:3-oxoacyl-ACP reductase-like protein
MIKDAIFGAPVVPAPAPIPEPAASVAQAPAPVPEAPPPAPVDVDAKIAALWEMNGKPNLNYKSSIVDLMKLLGMDSSLDNRKTLATELGYTGALDGSAEMNIWLHKAVMDQLRS